MKKRKSTFTQAIRKRHFLLLEVLIALTIASLCLFPLISGFIKLQIATTVQNRDLEKERLRDVAFCHIKEKFLEGALKVETGSVGACNDFTYKVETIRAHAQKKCRHVTVKVIFPKFQETLHFFLVGT